MKYFYAFMVYATEFELALAKKAPVRNSDNIAHLSERLTYWQGEQTKWEMSHAYK